jgi:hypothetical protein
MCATSVIKVLISAVLKAALISQSCQKAKTKKRGRFELIYLTVLEACKKKVLNIQGALLSTYQIGMFRVTILLKIFG